MDILLLVEKEIVLRWKVVNTANRKELAMAKKEVEDRQTKWEVTLWRTSMSVASKGIQHLHYFAVMEEALEEVCMVSILSKSTMNVGIDGFVQEVLIDSGSVSNLMGEEDFFKLRGLGLKGKAEHCSKKPFAYGRKQIDVIGQFRAVVCTGNVKVSTDFVIVKRGHCLLANVTARELSVLYVGRNAAPGVGRNTVQDDLASELKMK